MPMITLNSEQYEGLARMASSLMRSRKDLKPGEWRKPQHQAVKGFAKRFAAPVEPVLEYCRVVNRSDLRIIQELTEAAVHGLQSNIIPAYEKRIEEHPDKKSHYIPYLQQAQNTLKVYREIREKAEALL